jgi:transcriptional regulator with GAF, ATPase, and Fis domain/tetratricopeptide (TPR) repeat protein
MTGALLDDRFRVLGSLGAGAGGEVYLAEDERRQGERIALKLARSGPLLWREFGQLARLRHPHLVEVLDFGRLADGRSFLCSELVDGVDLRRFAREHPDAELAVVVMQVCRALHYLHARGVVHGDLKPENILVAEGPLAKLVDFGLSERVVVEAEPRERISGTLRFMAPELLDGAAPSLATDLFGLGATLAEVLAPRSALTEIARWLCAERPCERPARAIDVIAALAGRLGSELPSAELEGAYFSAPAFIGRELALQRIESGRGLILVRGAEGVGKTSLLRELRVRALLQGRRCQLVESEPASQPRLFAALALELEPAALAEQGGALDRIVDLQVSRATARASGELLLVDDLEAGDELTIRVLERLRRGQIRCCATVDGARWSERHDRLAEGAALLELEGLSLEEIGGLLADTLPEHAHPPQVVEEIRSATEGNPRLVLELLRAAVEAGQIAPREPCYRIDLPRTDLRELARARLGHLASETRQDLVRLALFESAAPPALVRSAGDLLGRGLASEVDAGLRVANRWLRAELLETLDAGARLRAHADLAAELGAIRDRTEAQEQELAEQLALADQRAESAARCLALAARSAARLDLPEAIALASRAAERGEPGGEVRAQALAELARLRRLCADHVGALAAHQALLATLPEDRAAEARLDRVETWLAMGSTREALSDLEQLGHAGRGEARRRTLWAKALFQRGDHAGAADQARAALREPALAPSIEADLENILGLCQLARGAVEEALSCFDRALDSHRARGDLHGMARTTNSRGLALQQQGDLAGAAEAYAECLELARQAGDPQLQTIYTLNAGTVAQQTLHHAEALHLYREGLSLARSLCSEREEARLALNLGNLMLQLGDLDEAETLLSRAEESATRLGLEDLLLHARLFAAELALDRRDPARARALASACAASFAARGSPTSVEAELLLARAALELGDRGAATVATARVRRARPAGALLGWAWFVEACAAVDDRTAARRLGEALQLARRFGVLDLRWLVHQRLAEVAATAEDRAAQAAQSAGALEELRHTIPAPYRVAFERVHVEPRRGPSQDQAERDAGAPPAGLRDLLRINRELTREHRPERVLELILDRAVELVGAERGFLILAEQGRLRVAVARNIDQETLRKKAFKFSRSLAERVLESGEPVLTGSATDDDRFRRVESVHELHLRSVVCVPLQMQEKTLGALYLDNRFRRSAFAESHLELLGALADQAAIALESARLIEEVSRRARELAEAKTEVERLNLQLRATVDAQADSLDQLAARLDDDGIAERHRSSVVGRSKAIREVLRIVERVAPTDVPVLLQGETGTGKEVIAKAIHRSSPRRGGPFVSVNCSAIPAALLESELYGHARGSFTGAVRDKVGLFQVAAGGTLLLDEIGDLPLELQSKLLRVLQEGRYRRVGEEEERTAEARIVSASLHDLSAQVAEGRFREDLYFRLNVVAITLPPLRERPEDIPDLVEHFLSAITPQPSLDRAAMALLLRHAWPGNVRELENELRRAAILGDDRIVPEVLSPKLRRASPLVETGPASLAKAVASAERSAIERALDRSDGSVTRAAGLLGVSRVVLHRKLRRHSIRRPR